MVRRKFTYNTHDQSLLGDEFFKSKSDSTTKQRDAVPVKINIFTAADDTNYKFIERKIKIIETYARFQI